MAVSTQDLTAADTDVWRVPFAHVKAADRFVILTDDAMDPWVWKSAAKALEDRGAIVQVARFARLPYHCAAPPDDALELAKKADVILALTSTALNSGTPALRAIRSEGGGTGKTPIWLMEQISKEILLHGGGRSTAADVAEICQLQGRIGAILDHSRTIRVTSAGGTDLSAVITGMPPGYFRERWEKLPFVRDPQTDRLGGGTWPFGEIHVEPLPGTAQGVVVWDVTAHYPQGRWEDPVRLHIDKGRVTEIEGGKEAAAIRDYLARYGDESSRLVGGEIAIGTNRQCPPGTYSMRSEKKRYGAMHFGIGHGADRGLVNSCLRLEGIAEAPTVYADDTLICQAGQIKV